MTRPRISVVDVPVKAMTTGKRRRDLATIVAGVLKTCPKGHNSARMIHDEPDELNSDHTWSVVCHHEPCGWRAGYWDTEAEAIAAWNTRAPAEVTEEMVKMVARLLCCGQVNPLTPAGECCRPDDCYAILERSNENRASRFSQMDMARKVCAALLAARQP